MIETSEFLVYAFATSLKVFFVYRGMEQGHILFPLRRFFAFLLSKTPLWFEQYAKKPLYDCVFCMGSFWGIIFSLPMSTKMEITGRNFVAMIFFLMIVASMNYILGHLTSKNEKPDKNQKSPS